MKKVIFFLVIVLASTQLRGAEPYQYGQYWQGLSKDMKENYVNGFKDGVANALYHVRAKSYLDKDPRTQKELKSFEEAMKDLIDIHSNERVLAEVMTDLYKDPANVYIPSTEILVIAQAKLDGKPVEGRLLEQRKLVFETLPPSENRKMALKR
ncbi:MAG: hypothetical protein ACHQKY_15785 [Terriglobia bacterium]|jgi:hypothetical protein